MQSYEVGFHLLPLPKAAQRSEGHGQSSQGTGHTYGGKGNNWQNSRSQPYKSKGGRAGGKGKTKGGKGVLPKFLLGRDNTNMDTHGRRLCLNYQTGRCSDAPDGGECVRGWHFLCCCTNCFAPHPEKDHDKKKLRCDRIGDMVKAGAGLDECLVIEVFAGTGRVTACVKQLGMTSAFGTDHVRHEQAMSQIVLADLTTKAGVELLMQWFSNHRVVGLFLASPCGSASRARAIPLKRKRPGDPPAPKPATVRQTPEWDPWHTPC